MVFLTLVLVVILGVLYGKLEHRVTLLERFNRLREFEEESEGWLSDFEQPEDEPEEVPEAKMPQDKFAKKLYIFLAENQYKNLTLEQMRKGAGMGMANVRKARDYLLRNGWVKKVKQPNKPLKNSKQFKIVVK